MTSPCFDCQTREQHLQCLQVGDEPVHFLRVEFHGHETVLVVQVDGVALVHITLTADVLEACTLDFSRFQQWASDIIPCHVVPQLVVLFILFMCNSSALTRARVFNFDSWNSISRYLALPPGRGLAGMTALACPSKFCRNSSAVGQEGCVFSTPRATIGPPP